MHTLSRVTLRWWWCHHHCNYLPNVTFFHLVAIIFETLSSWTLLQAWLSKEEWRCFSLSPHFHLITTTIYQSRVLVSLTSPTRLSQSPAVSLKLQWRRWWKLNVISFDWFLHFEAIKGTLPQMSFWSWCNQSWWWWWWSWWWWRWRSPSTMIYLCTLTVFTQKLN